MGFLRAAGFTDLQASVCIAYYGRSLTVREIAAELDRSVGLISETLTAIRRLLPTLPPPSRGRPKGRVMAASQSLASERGMNLDAI